MTWMNSQCTEQVGSEAEWWLIRLIVYHAEDVEDFVTFDFPYTNENGEFSRVENSQLGFIG